MVEGPIIIAVLVAGVVGGTVGAALTSLYWSRRKRLAFEEKTRREVLASWLAARIALGRASISFVTAFRSLAAERRESLYFSLRQDEAQRARAHWVRVTHDLDIAEASLRVWYADSGIAARAERLGRIPVESLRAAIDGGETEADHVSQSVQDLDRQAIAFAERAIIGSARSRPMSALRDLFRRVVAKLEAVTNGWARDDS